MARAGRFGAGLSPFGGGVLNIDAAYQVEGLNPTPSPPQVGAPPPIDYGGSPSQTVPQPPVIPIVGPTPVPPGAVGQGEATLQPWSPTPAAPTAVPSRLALIGMSGTDLHTAMVSPDPAVAAAARVEFQRRRRVRI